MYLEFIFVNDVTQTQQLNSFFLSITYLFFYIRTGSHLILTILILIFHVFKIYFIDCAFIVAHFFPIYSPPPCTQPPTCIPCLSFMSMGGCTCKFFGFYISYTILNLPLSIFYLPFMLLISCTFSPSIPLHLPH